MSVLLNQHFVFNLQPVYRDCSEWLRVAGPSDNVVSMYHHTNVHLRLITQHHHIISHSTISPPHALHNKHSSRQTTSPYSTPSLLHPVTTTPLASRIISNHPSSSTYHPPLSLHHVASPQIIHLFIPPPHYPCLPPPHYHYIAFPLHHTIHLLT